MFENAQQFQSSTNFHRGDENAIKTDISGKKNNQFAGKYVC